MPKTNFHQLGEVQYRTAELRADGVDEESRTVDLSFSSETPIERWYGTEILDHSPSSVRLERFNGGAALLVNHERNDQVGVIEAGSAKIGSDKMGRAVVKFSKSTRGQEILDDVRDGIRTLVSVGYWIYEAVLEKHDDNGDTYRITDWEPMEVSIVSVPADVSVGVGRAKEEIAMPPEIRTEEVPTEEIEQEQPGDTTVLEDAARKEREDRHGKIRNLAAEFRHVVPEADEIAERSVSLDLSVDEFRGVLKQTFLARRPEPVPVTPREPRFEMNFNPRNRQLPGFANTRDGLEQAYRAGMWARAELFLDQRAARWCKDYGVRVATTETIGGGAAVVPDELSSAIIDLREQYGTARQYCYIHPMASDSTTIPRRAGGVTAYFVGQTEATTASDKSWDQVQLNARELSSLSRFSMAYAEDAVIDVASDLAREAAYAYAVKEDSCLFNGDGTSTYGGMYGIRPKIIDGNHTAGAVDVATATHNLFSELDADDLNGPRGKLPEFPGIQPAWYCSKYAKVTVFDALKAAGGGNTVITLEGRPNAEWLGDPVRVNQGLPAGVSTDYDSAAMLIYGDLRMGATLGDRRGFSIQVLRERYAEFRQIGVIGWERFDIVVHGLGDTSNAGPIVALIGSSS